MSYIKCEELVLGYEGTPVAEHISFSVERETICVLWVRMVRGRVRS